MAYEPAIIELTGILVQQSHFGPPGFGQSLERDLQVIVPLLRLACPVNVRASVGGVVNSENIVAIPTIQLNIPTELQGWEAFIGTSVTVTGQLSQAMTGHHYTSVILAVSGLVATREKND